MMTVRAKHNNTKAILRAWERLSSDMPGTGIDPRVSDFPDLLGNLFVLKRADAGIWPFTNAGDELAGRLGRELVEQDFLALWRGRDMGLVSAQLDAIRYSGTPGILRAQGETLSGQLIEIEITLAPLRNVGLSGDRVLGLYQFLEDEKVLNGRPVWRHSVHAIYPPAIQRQDVELHLIASNE